MPLSFGKTDRCKHYRNRAKERRQSNDDHYQHSIEGREDQDVHVAGKNAEGKDVHNVGGSYKQ